MSATLTQRPHVLLVLRPAIELYPPSVHQANILVEQGFQVSVAQESPFSGASIDAGLNPEVQRYYTHSNTEARSLLGRLMRVALFRNRIKRLVKQIRPEIVIAFDAEVAHALGDHPKRCGMRLVWHFHELPEREPEGCYVRFANSYVWRNTRVPDLIVFPDPGRASVFAQDAGMDAKNIQIVANCPRPIQQLPQPLLRQTLGDRLPAKARIVLYHGAVGLTHGLENAIRSMPQWPADTVFVIKGRNRPEYAQSLMKLAEAAGVADRVIVFDPGFQSLSEHYAMIAGADVGWTVLEPRGPAWTYSAFASNKRFECMALGVPQIADANPSLPELIEGNGCGFCIPQDDVKAAGNAVSRILSDESSRIRMVENGRAVHLRTWNYDHQFQPVLKVLRSWVNPDGNPR